MTLDGEVAALHRVEVVEPDRECGAESLCDSRPENALGLLRQKELEPDLHRRPVAEEDPALGRDQLVRPREVRLVGLDSELRPQPLTSPGAW